MDFLVQDRIGRRLVDGLASSAGWCSSIVGASGSPTPSSTGRPRSSASGPRTSRRSSRPRAPGRRSWSASATTGARPASSPATRPDALEALVLYEPTGPADPVEISRGRLGPGRRHGAAGRLDRARLPEPRRRPHLPRVVRPGRADRREPGCRRRVLRATPGRAARPAPRRPARHRGADPRPAAAGQPRREPHAAGSRWPR